MPPKWRWLETAIAVILLALFGLIEVEAVFDNNAIDMAIAALGVVGSAILLWLRRPT